MEIQNLISIETVLIAMTDTSNLRELVSGLLRYCPGAKIYVLSQYYEATCKAVGADLERMLILFDQESDTLRPDLVVADLRPLPEEGNPADFSEHIDYDGINLLWLSVRAYANVLVVTNPGNYEELIQKIAVKDAKIDLQTRLEFNDRVFDLLEKYGEEVIRRYEKINQFRSKT
ncbi:MAG: hypothetical protein WC453_02610 [Patescibacteria group bacterium]